MELKGECCSFISTHFTLTITLQAFSESLRLIWSFVNFTSEHCFSVETQRFQNFNCHDSLAKIYQGLLRFLKSEWIIVLDGLFSETFSPLRE